MTNERKKKPSDDTQTEFGLPVEGNPPPEPKEETKTEKRPLHVYLPAGFDPSADRRGGRR